MSMTVNFWYHTIISSLALAGQAVNFYIKLHYVSQSEYYFEQGLVKGAILCFRNPYLFFRHGESTYTASQLTSPASQKNKDLNKVSLFLQDLGYNTGKKCD